MSDTAQKTSGRKINWAVFIPVAAFVALAGLFAIMLMKPHRDTSVVPSVLIGKPAPETALPAIPGLTAPDGSPVAGFDPAKFPDHPILVNVWASWCAPCREEHPLLLALSKQEGVIIAGLNYKDKPKNAIGFLEGLGNPYAIAGADTSGRAAIEWGVYGVPESYIVSGDGTILYKHVGPLTPEVISTEILPRLRGEKTGS
jgi:cytochrome c biogenesis protein CcmG/thiol:disulfide interchange protein DsbE